MKTKLLLPTVMMFCLAIVSCTRNKVQPVANVPTGPSLVQTYSSKIGGTRLWKHYENVTIGGTDTTYYYNDTSFGLNVMNDTSLNVFGNVFTYLNKTYYSNGFMISVDTTNRLTYVQKGVGPHSISLLNYYYKNNSITISFTSGGLGGSGATIYQTK